MKKLPKIGVLILHFGKRKTTLECLDSLKLVKQVNFKLFTIVVDNSLDQDKNSLLENHSIVDKFVVPDHNLGFAEGNNFASKIAIKHHCDYLLLLNNDTVVTPNFLDNLIKQRDNFAILGPVLKHQVGSQVYFDYGGYIDWAKSQPKHINLNKDKKIVGQKKHNPTQVTKIKKRLNDSVIERDFISGCCLLISSDNYQRLGGLDQRFFMYLEDVDLCLKAKRQKMKVGLVPKSQIFHKGSQSSTQWLKIRYSLINSLRINWRYNSSKYKLRAIFWLIYFYPALFILWKLKDFKKQLFK